FRRVDATTKPRGRCGSLKRCVSCLAGGHMNGRRPAKAGRYQRKWVLGLVVLACAADARAQRVVRYEPAGKDLKSVDATGPPVATLDPGDTLETRTADCFGGVIQKPGDTLALVKGDNPLTGPFAIRGAEPGDTLAVTFLDLTVDSSRGIGSLAPGFGALNATTYTPMLNGQVPEKIWFYDIDRRANVATYHALDSTFS